MFSYDLTIGLPHTNYNQLAEHLMLMHLGHFQWQSIAASIRTPLSHLRTVDQGEVYATFYYIEERIPESASLTEFRLDDTLRVLLQLRAFRNIAFDGRLIFHHKSFMETAKIEEEESLLEAYAGDVFPAIRFANVFVTPHAGNAALKLAPPAHVSFDGIPVLSNEDNAYHITRSAEKTGTFRVFDTRWNCINPDAPFTSLYTVHPDRDSNGAGLVYFANYIIFLDMAERALLLDPIARRWPVACVPTRTLRFRQLAYFGNADLGDTLRIEIYLFYHEEDRRRLGFRYTIMRERDKARICLSEAIKTILLP
ncbi:MAG: hypothetical protein FJY97_20045 [candidate division Zixibacteria bacterium]|nr:hypothetical protein [candidate division Zixibacteria bacterium]